MKLTKALWMAVTVLVSASFAVAHAQVHYVQLVAKAPTTLTLTTSAKPIVGQPVTITAHLVPTISGNIAFSLSSSAIPPQTIPVTASGQASWTVTFPSVGNYTVLAQYPGDSNHKSSSAVTTEQVVYPGAPDFSIAVDPGQTIKPGQTWASLVHLKAINGFADKVNLTCSDGLDKTMSCDFQSAAVTPTPVGVATKLSIKTAGETVTVVTGALLPLYLLFVPTDGRKRRRRLKVALLSLGACLLLAGCGARSRFLQSDGTPPGTYYITVTGTSGSITHSANVTVVVK